MSHTRRKSYRGQLQSYRLVIRYPRAINKRLLDVQYTYSRGYMIVLQDIL